MAFRIDVCSRALLRARACSAIGVILAVALLFPAIAIGQPGPVVGKNVEAALLSEDWAKVAELLKPVDTLTESPVLRLLKGHACLATNQNNFSVCMFLDVMTEDSARVSQDLGSWADWTQTFADAHPKASVAHYLMGDSKARQHKWDEAVGWFDKALALNPAHGLVLNARGVACASEGKMSEARVAFDDAMAARPQLADVHASIGALRMQQKNGASGAMAAFGSALSFSPEFALALYGRGCVGVVLDSMDNAKRDMDAAAAKTLCGAGRALLDASKLKVLAHVYGLKEEEVASALADTSRDVGTTFDAKVGRVDELLGNYLDRQTQGNYNALAGAFGRLPKVEQEKFFNERMKPVMASMPDLPKHNTELGNWNRPGGWANKIADVLGITSAATNLIPDATTLTKVGGLTGTVAARKMSGWNAEHFNTFNRINDLTGAASVPKAGGVDASWAKASWDDGDWPFLPYYGLMYVIDTGTLPSQARE